MPWGQKEIQVSNRVANLLLDSRFCDKAPIKELPQIHWFGVWCQRPAPNGRFVAADEEQTLLQLERKLIEVAGRISNGWAVYVMRIMSQGLLEFYLYARDSSTLNGVTDELKKIFPNYRIEHDSQNDSDWAEYSKYYATFD